MHHVTCLSRCCMTSNHFLLRPHSSSQMPPNRGPPPRRQLTADVTSMRYEKNRLATFGDWPLDAPVPKERLAKAGFYFKSAPYRVECFSCGNTIDDWAFNEQAMLKHRQLFPLCPFVLDRSDNVPASADGSSGGGSPQPTQDSGYSSSQSPASSQESTASTSPRTGFRFPAAVATSGGGGGGGGSGGGGGGGGGGLTRGGGGGGGGSGSQRTWLTFSFLKRERQRLRTFEGWPLDFIAPADLAAAGFFFLKEGDKAQCIFCRGIVGDWELGDVPTTEHARHFPQCPFVRGRECGNVPAECDSDSDESIEERTASQEDWGHDEVGHRLDIRTHSVGDNDRRGRLTSTNLNVRTPQGAAHTSDLSQLGISEHYAPVHPSYATVESRLRSYQFWPPALAQKPQQLAEAGFFYAGVSDHVKCFHCDGGLRNWVPGDDPWTEHARWFGRCGFVQLVKGDEFVQGVLRSHPQEAPALATQEQGVDDTAVKRCPLTDEELESMMENAICKTAVELGVAREAVKRVLKQRLESTGLPFTDLSSVLAMAFNHTHATYLPPSSGPEVAGPSHVRAGSTLSAASSGGDSGMEDAHSQQSDIDVSEEPEPAPADVQMSTQLSHESTTSTLTNSSSSGSGNNTPKVLSPSAGLPKVTAAGVESSLEEENQRLKEQKQCKVCMDEEVGVVFLPCGHLITCVNCAPALRDCPLCRQPIKGTVRTYLS